MNRLLGFLACALLLACGASFAEVKTDYPNRPVRFLVPGGAGTGTDLAFRALAEQMTQKMGESFYVENKPGAGGNIGLAYGAVQKADGYTLIGGFSSGLSINEFLYTPTELGFIPERDLEPVAMTGSVPMVIVVNANSPYKTLSDLVAAAKAKPNTINVASITSTSKLLVEMFSRATGAQLFTIPFTSSPNSMAALMGDQIDVVIDTVTAARPAIQGGKIRALAVTSRQRTELLPGVPTALELGLKDYELSAWNALCVPRGTPPEIRERLRAAVRDILRDPDYRAKLLNMGFEPSSEQDNTHSPHEFIRSERTKWGGLIKSAGITR